MPGETTALICKIEGRLDWAAAEPYIKLLYSRYTWMDRIYALRDLFSKVKKPGISIDELPGQTSLQRNIKQFLKSGGKIGSAQGILEAGDFVP